MDNYIGRLLDNRYEILEVIGTGGMAVVYKARCHRLNRLVAIKILKDEFSQDAEFRRRFHAESQAVAMLSHPNIVNVYDVSRSENVDYIVMELIDGITLKQYMEQKGVLNWREALHFATQIAKALEHAHSRGIIHRDIKPHNIMILKDGSVKVADFGIARVSSAQSTLTREALGSVHYISPEQAKGGKIDYRSDLYSLGVVMYEMLTGRTPYDGETPVAVAIQHINANAARPRDWNPQIPLGLEQITMHAMSADLNSRYESATEMLTDLDEFRKNPSNHFDFSSAAVLSQTAERSSVRTAAERAVRAKTEQMHRTAETGNRKRFNSGVLAAGIICILLAVSAIGYFLYSFFFADLFAKTEEITVPPLVGAFVENIDAARYPGLVIEIAEWASSDKVEQGRVIRQDPVEGRLVKSGTTVSLVVSSGPSTDTMRDLVNYTLENAETILDNLDMDLRVTVLYENSDIYTEGAVIRTIPSKDEPLTAKQEVTLVVSLGRAIRRVPVPELVGKDVEEAVDLLDTLNLKYGISYVDAEEYAGTVVFQSIPQGEEVKEGMTINLQISSGPAEPEDPDEEENPNEENPDEENPDEEIPPDPLLPQEQVIYIPVPDADDSYEVSIKMDGEESYEPFLLNPETVADGRVPITQRGQGIHQIDIYIDGILWHTMIYDFDTGEVLQ